MPPKTSNNSKSGKPATTRGSNGKASSDKPSTKKASTRRKPEVSEYFDGPENAFVQNLNFTPNKNIYISKTYNDAIEFTRRAVNTNKEEMYKMAAEIMKACTMIVEDIEFHRKSSNWNEVEVNYQMLAKLWRISETISNAYNLPSEVLEESSADMQKLASKIESSRVMRPTSGWPSYEDLASGERWGKLISDPVIRRMEESIKMSDRPSDWPELPNILLTGPPGSGKTQIVYAHAEAMARFVEDWNENNKGKPEKGFVFLQPTTGKINDKLFGNSEKIVEMLFKKAANFVRQGKFVLIFFEEMENFFGSKSSKSPASAVSGAFKSATGNDLSGLNGICLMGNTNHPSNLSSAIQSRFQTRYYIGFPTDVDFKNNFEIWMSTKKPYRFEHLNPSEMSKKIASLSTKMAAKNFTMRDASQMKRDVDSMLEKETKDTFVMGMPSEVVYSMWIRETKSVSTVDKESNSLPYETRYYLIPIGYMNTEWVQKNFLDEVTGRGGPEEVEAHFRVNVKKVEGYFKRDPEWATLGDKVVSKKKIKEEGTKVIEGAGFLQDTLNPVDADDDDEAESPWYKKGGVVFLSGNLKTKLYRNTEIVILRRERGESASWRWFEFISIRYNTNANVANGNIDTAHPIVRSLREEIPPKSFTMALSPAQISISAIENSISSIKPPEILEYREWIDFFTSDSNDLYQTILKEKANAKETLENVDEMKNLVKAERDSVSSVSSSSTKVGIFSVDSTATPKPSASSSLDQREVIYSVNGYKTINPTVRDMLIYVSAANKSESIRSSLDPPRPSIFGGGARVATD